jgi:glycine hydroxymethyltransferase
MDLNAGGHLTHGAKVSFSGTFYESVTYGIDPQTERLDYEQIRQIALKERPQMIVAGASAYSRIIDWQKFREIADEVGAFLMVDMAHIAGLVAVGLHPSPVGIADVVTTTTHKTLRGPRGGMILSQAKYAKQINFAVFPQNQGGPLEHVIAAKAVALGEALRPEFKDYQAQVIKNAQAMAEVFENEPDLHVVTGGTDNHLMTVDLTQTGHNGKEIQDLLDTVYITLNKEAIPDEKLSPFKTSGIRIGTPAVTTRGFNEADSRKVAELIIRAIHHVDEPEVLAQIKQEVFDLTDQYPLS